MRIYELRKHFKTEGKFVDIIEVFNDINKAITDCPNCRGSGYRKRPTRRKRGTRCRKCKGNGWYLPKMIKHRPDTHFDVNV